MGRVVVCSNRETALQDWFNWHFKDLKMGLIMAITGNFQYRFGVGKSYTALRIGELLDKNFCIEKVVFEPKDFKRAIEEIEGRKIPYGQVMVLDEAGILVNAKKWTSFINRSIASAMMTFRELRGLVIAVTPALRFIDSDIRIMLSHLGECEKVIEKNEKVKLKLFKLNWSETESKFYRYRIVMFNKEANRLEKFNEFWVNFPQNKELVDAYEKRVGEYKMKVRKEAISEASLIEDQREMENIVEEIISNKDIVKENKVNWEDLRVMYGFSILKSKYIARKCNERLGEKVG